MTERPCGYHWSTRGGTIGSNHECVKAQHSAAELHECGSCDARCAVHEEEPRPLTDEEQAAIEVGDRVYWLCDVNMSYPDTPVCCSGKAVAVDPAFVIVDENPLDPDLCAFIQRGALVSVPACECEECKLPDVLE